MAFASLGRSILGEDFSPYPEFNVYKIYEIDKQYTSRYYVKITVLNKILFHERNEKLSYYEGDTELLKG